MAKFVPRNPHFFQPLLPGFEDNFSIPFSFFKKFLKGLEFDKATLRSPVSGVGEKLWNVKINGRKFENGWKEFVQTHDLHVGYFLVFEHMGNMVFDVLVFDLSTCEKEITTFHVKEEKIEIEEEEEIIEVEEEEKEEEIVEIEEEEEEEEEEIAEKSAPENPKRTNLKRKCFEACNETEYPYFVAQLKSSFSKEGRTRLHMPTSFARMHNLSQRCCKMLLFDQENRSWPVNLWFRKSDNRVYIARGWHDCLIANGLKGGDSVIFQLIENGEMPVFKFSKNPKRKNETEYPYFVAKLASSFSREWRRRLYVPTSFARMHDLSQRCCKMLLFDQQYRSWPVNLGFSKSENRVYMARGWHDCRIANGLKGGDSVIFQLIENGEMPVLKFSKMCFNASEKFDTEKQPIVNLEVKASSILEHPEELKKKQKPTKSKASSVLEHPEELKNQQQPMANLKTRTCSSFLEITVRSRSANQSRVYIKDKFAKLYNLSRRCGEIILMDLKERDWPATLWKCSFGAYINGWRNFHLANNLKTGQTLSFKLIETQKETIFKLCSFNNSGKLIKKMLPETTIRAKANSSIRGCPHFVAHVTSTSVLHSRLYIPMEFTRIHNLNDTCEIILMNQMGRTWLVKLWKRKLYEIYARDWNTFCVANGLKLGESFIFTLIEKDKRPVLKMFRLNVKHEEADCSSPVRRPHLYFIMTASHFKSYQLKIPRNFSKWHCLIESSKMILENEYGRSWSVSLKQDNFGRLYMAGWADFAEANDLQVGSMFMLELVRGGVKPIMKFNGINQDIVA